MFILHDSIGPSCENPVSLDAIADNNQSDIFYVGDKINYKCRNGFFMFAGTNHRECLLVYDNHTDYAIWSGKPPICLPVGSVSS